MTDGRLQITLADPHGSEQEEWRGDLMLASFFLIAAALILGVINPIYVSYVARPIETVVAVVLASAPIVWGLVKGQPDLVLRGSCALLILVALCLLTQPHALGVPLSDVWPLRALLLLLVAGSWVFLLRPPLWVRRALAGLLLTLVPVMLCAGGPLVLAQFSQVPRTPVPQFSPYWLAFDNQERLYATSSTGGYIWAFSPGGVPLGVIRPHLAPDAGNGEIGFRPIGFPSPTPQLHRTGNLIGQPVTPPYTFCGLAIDGHDRLYVIDPTTLTLVKMRADGTVEKRTRLPDDYLGPRGCLAAEGGRVYVASRLGQIYVMDGEGKIERELNVTYQPFGITPDGKGNLLVLAPDHIDRINIATGGVTLLPNPPPQPGGARAPFQAIAVAPNGEIVVNDLANATVLRIAPEGGRLSGTVGKPGSVRTGFAPGQFGGLGGLALDREGRIYVADWQLSAIQRFSPEGTLQAIITAPGDVQPIAAEEENE